MNTEFFLQHSWSENWNVNSSQTNINEGLDSGAFLEISNQRSKKNLWRVFFFYWYWIILSNFYLVIFLESKEKGRRGK